MKKKEFEEIAYRFSPNPERTLTIPLKVVEELDYEETKRLAWVTGLSQFLTSFLMNEGRIKELLNPVEETISVEQHLKKIAEKSPEYSKHDFLIKYKYTQLIRIAIMEMKGLENYEKTLYELSSLYDALIIATYNMVRGDKDPLLIYALGKLGGQEINLSSDVDIILLCRDNEDLDTALKTAKKFLFTLSERKMGRFILRPDIDLRPHGRFSPPVTSISHAVEYYFTKAEGWERYALIKLRPLWAQNDEFSYIAERFVFRRYLDITAIEEISDLKKKIEVEEEKGREWNVKLGKGGIRELEFFLQSFQVLYGGKAPVLKERNTFKLIKKLAYSGLLDKKTAQEIQHRYAFLRKLENAIQWENEIQTHKLPLNPKARRVISKKMLMTEDEFENELKITLNFVRTHFENTFKRDTESRFCFPFSERDIEKFVPHLSASEKKALHKELNELGEGKGSKTLEKLARIVEITLETAHRNPISYQAIHRFIEFLSSISRFTPYLGFISEKREVVEYIIEVLSKNEYISEFLSKEPYLLENLLTFEGINFDRRSLKEELTRRIATIETLEELIEEINRFKNEFTLYIMVKDLIYNSDVEEIFGYITDIADTIVWVCLSTAKCIAFGEKNLQKFLNKDDDFPMLVIGMGKYGGRELNYHSDLDLIFIYKDEKHHTTIAKIAQKLLFLLTTPTIHGTLYKTDTRLRPSGRAGQLVSSLSSFKIYHTRSSQTWERQALLKSRPVAGSTDIWNEMKNFMLEQVFKNIDIKKTRRELIEMRKKMTVREARGKGWDLKMMDGGIVDIEFIVQFLQLINIPKYKFLLTPSTLTVINLLREVDILNDKDFYSLKGRYLFLRDVERSLRLMMRRSEDFLKIEHIGEVIKLLKTEMENERQFILELNIVREDVKNLYRKFFDV